MDENAGDLFTDQLARIQDAVVRLFPAGADVAATQAYADLDGCWFRLGERRVRLERTSDVAAAVTPYVGGVARDPIYRPIGATSGLSILIARALRDEL